MKSLQSIIEAVDIRTYIDNYSHIERFGLAKEYLSEFWKILGEYCTSHGGFISRNGYRIYIPIPKNFAAPTGDPLHLGAEFKSSKKGRLRFNKFDLQEVLDALSPEDTKISRDLFDLGFFKNICGCVEAALRNKGIDDAYIDFTENFVSWHDIMGREKTMKLTKLIPDPDVREGYTKFLTFISTPKNKMLLCFSNHKYDIVGISANRRWTSCMNVYGGAYIDYLKKDIEEGVFVGYVVSDKDTNIEDPFARISILPATNKSGHIIYVPAPRVYSPFNGLDKMRDFVVDIFQDIYDTHSELTVDPLLYADGNVHPILKTRGKYRGFDITNLMALPLPTKRGQVAYYRMINELISKTDFSGNIRRPEDLYIYVLCAILVGAIFIYDGGWETIPCGRKDFYKILSDTFKNFERYQRDVEKFISDNVLYNMWKFETSEEAGEYIRKFISHKDLENPNFRNFIINAINSELRDTNGLEEEYLYRMADSIKSTMEYNDIIYSIVILMSGAVESDEGLKYAICLDNFIEAWEGTYSDKVLQDFLKQYEKNGGIIKYKTRNEAEKGTGLSASW